MKNNSSRWFIKIILSLARRKLSNEPKNDQTWPKSRFCQEKSGIFNLNGQEFYHKYTTWEFNRLIVTKYRTSSHYLHINTGRAANIPRNDRVCKCGQLQTLCHVLFNCIHTRMIKMAPYANVNDLELFFALDIEHVAFILSNIEKELKLRWLWKSSSYCLG